jgi:hypothetical protein
MSIMPLKSLLLNCLAITFIYIDNNEIIMYTTVFKLVFKWVYLFKQEW